MRHTVLIGALVLTLLCSAEAVATVWSSSSRVPIIYTLPVYPNARNVVYRGSRTWVTPASKGTGMVTGTNSQSSRSSIAGQSLDPNSAVLSFEAGGSPQAVASYYDGWFTAHGWASQTYGQAQVPGTSQFAAYSLDGSPDPGRAELLGIEGAIPRFYVPRSHARVYVNAYLVGGTVLVEIQAFKVEY